MTEMTATHRIEALQNASEDDMDEGHWMYEDDEDNNAMTSFAKKSIDISWDELKDRMHAIHLYTIFDAGVSGLTNVDRSQVDDIRRCSLRPEYDDMSQENETLALAIIMSSDKNNQVHENMEDADMLISGGLGGPCWQSAMSILHDPKTSWISNILNGGPYMLNRQGGGNPFLRIQNEGHGHRLAAILSSPPHCMSREEWDACCSLSVGNARKINGKIVYLRPMDEVEDFIDRLQGAQEHRIHHSAIFKKELIRVIFNVTKAHGCDDILIDEYQFMDITRSLYDYPEDFAAENLMSSCLQIWSDNDGFSA